MKHYAYMEHALDIGRRVRCAGFGRIVTAIAASLCMITGTVAPGNAEEYPGRVVRMIVPFAPGGPVDLLGRQMAMKLRETLGQAVIVENRPGANGTVGSSHVAKSEPDGYTMLMMSGSHTANASIYSKMTYDPLNDFIGITQLATSGGMVLVVHPEFPATDVDAFVKLARANPMKYTFGHAGIGNATHVSPELFASVAGISLLPVPYSGGGGPIAAVLGKEVDVSFSSTTAITPHVKAGRMKALVMTGVQRSPSLPDVPTVVETGFKEAVFAGYYGLWFPKGTPKDRVERMHKAAIDALNSSEIKRYLEAGGAAAVGSSPADFAKFLVDDLAEQAAIAKRIGLKPM